MQGEWQGLSLTPCAVPGCSPESVQGLGEVVGAVYWAEPGPVPQSLSSLVLQCWQTAPVHVCAVPGPAGNLPTGLWEP